MTSEANAAKNTQAPSRPAAPPAPDLSERGAGEQRSDTRLYFQLLAFTGCRHTPHLAAHLEQHAATPVVLYEDLHDPLGVALLTFATDPASFLTRTRSLVQSGPLADLTPRPELTMFGRTYAIGYEHDLGDTLIHRPTRYALNPETPWAVWYPLRRKGSFSRLSDEEQKNILKEHGTIGFAFGSAGYAHDIRLACHGLDRADNDFVIGLLGKELAPLSKLVQTMRATVQTSTWLEKLGPFFVGRAVYRSAGSSGG